MTMEALQRAARAAGYAMAAPDDDEAEAGLPRQSVPATGREMVVVPQALMLSAPQPRSTEPVLSAWVRGLLPTALGGRAPA
jgi:hypothetical protein